MGDKKPAGASPHPDRASTSGPLPGPAGWLRSRRVGVVLTGLALVILALTAIHPLMFGSLPRTDDALQHLHRLIALDYSIRYGDLWPRYSPTLLYGYGEPIFNYYSPLSLYPFELLHLLGLSFVSALIAGWIGYLLLELAGAYLLGRSWGGPLAGIGAAAAYTYAPYIIYNLLGRGAVGEIAALALLPWVLWAYRRLALHGRRSDFLLALALTALMILTHNISALQTVGLMIVYGLFVWWTGPHPPRFLVQMALAGILAVGVTAFFWLPALAESSYIQLDKTRVGVQNPPDAPEFDDEFQTLDQTLGLPQTADLTWFNPPIQRALGWPEIGLGLAGLALLAYRRRNHERRVLAGLMALLAVLVAILVFMTTQASHWVWAEMPLLHFFQFPWRMLGPASLLLALMAGIGLAQVAALIPSRVGRGLWAGVALAAIMVYSMPWLYHLYIPDPAASSVVDSQNYERQTGQLGGTARGEYTPAWAQELPDADRLAPLYAQGEVIPRLQPDPAVTVRQASWQPTSASLAVSTQTEQRLVFDWLYFPGWWATVDGQPAALTPTPKHGLISLDLPPGDHQLALGFGPTPLRFGALIGSGVFAVLALLLVTTVYQLWLFPVPERAPAIRWSALLPAAAAAIVAGLAILALKAVLIDNAQTPIKRARFADGLSAGLEHPLNLVFGSQVTLLGFDLSASQAQPGQTLHLTLYWQPTAGVIPDDYTSSLALRDPAGSSLAQVDEFYPGGWATSNWVPGFYVSQPLDLAVPAGTPPGQYTLSVSLFSPKHQQNLTAAGADGAALGIQPSLAALDVNRPSQPAAPADLGIGRDSSLPRLDASLIPDLTLLAASPPPANATVGDSLSMATVWQAKARPSQPYGYSLLWLDGNGQVSAVSTPAPLTAGYPADQWQPGDLWRGSSRFYVPGRLVAGAYDVAIQLFDPSGQSVGAHAPVGRVVVATPPRTYTPPPRSVTSDVMWDDGITLIGYDLPQPVLLRGNILPLTLYWLPRSEVNTSLMLFVHLVDGDGNIVGQVDTIPAHSTRPTTGWASGEIITDAIELPVRRDAPAGRYYLRIGWDDPQTGARVHVQGSEFFLLPDIIRVQSGQ